MITFHSRARLGYILVAGLFCISACKKSPIAPPERTPEAPASLPMPSSRPAEGSRAPETDPGMDRALEKRYPGNPAEQDAVRAEMKKLDARLDEEERLAESRRRTMVAPAPSGFKPESAARKIRLKLILEKNKIRLGELPRFRLEMTNVGREAIEYAESSSSIFLSRGSLLSTSLNFYITDEKQEKAELKPGYPPPSSGPPPLHRPRRVSGLSEAEKEEVLLGVSGDLRIKLLPGETLRSGGDDHSAENFKPLIAKWGFLKPGIYRLHVELDDRPEPLSKVYIEASLRSGSTLEELRESHAEELRNALGPVSSNSVTLEVSR